MRLMAPSVKAGTPAQSKRQKKKRLKQMSMQMADTPVEEDAA